MIVYTVTMEGVYDQGTGGVFSTREAAEAHVKDLWGDSDGYHHFRVEEIEVDQGLWPVGRKRSWREVTKVPYPPDSSFVPWDDRGDLWASERQ